jgi:hypothetical protein
MRYWILLLTFISSLQLNAQVIIDTDQFKKRLHKMQLTNQVPKNLLSGKAIVVHAYPKAPEQYKKQAAILQPWFQKAGIDAVAHYLFEDIFSGKEVIAAYRDQINGREVDFIIYYIAGREHELIIMPFTESFFANTAFHIKDRNQEQMLDNLYLKAARSDQERLNLLILNVAAYPDYPKIIKGRRGEFYDLNMKSGKVAIPKTEDSLLNKAIDSVMASHYPYQYGFVEAGSSDADLRKEGYRFIMYAVHASGRSVRKYLGYETSPKETAYASIVENNGETETKNIDINTPVYKFYVKHVNSGDVYLGKHYDADEQWHVALKNYIYNLRNILYR